MTRPTSRGSRLPGRLLVVGRAAATSLRDLGRRRRPAEPARILVAHHLLLGDTLMLTPLLAKLAQRHPAAEVVHALPEAFAPLYATRPYGARALPWSPGRMRRSPMFTEPRFDLAIIPGDNRHAWLARALGARWIVAFAGDRPAHKNWAVDELVASPAHPGAWGDLVAGLVPGPPPAPFEPAQWPAPAATPFSLPARPYAVLHVGASSPLKLWPAARWQALAGALGRRGLEVAWSAGRGEEDLVAQCDPQQRSPSYAGRLALAQLWHLLAGADLLICPDTGVAHLGRVVGTPTVTLFGPGSAVICGAGEFWRNAAYRAVTVEPFACRDQRTLFRREIEWVRRCGRGPRECESPRCMHAIELEAALAAVDALGRERAATR